jgi:hypothetical protein
MLHTLTLTLALSHSDSLTWLLKSQLNQNLIFIHPNSNGDFKSHVGVCVALLLSF